MRLVRPIVTLGAVALVIGTIVGSCNMSNSFIPAGYAGYIQQRPWFSPAEYKGVKLGADSTGWCWRTNVQLVSITPFSCIENIKQIQAADNLMVDTEASITFTINGTENDVKMFFENYGGWDENPKNPDDLVRDAYIQFVRPQFKMYVRNAVSKYNALEVKNHFVDIRNEVMANMDEYLKDSPFKVSGIAIQSTTPPTSITDQINRKVAATQELERKRIETESALQDGEIAEARGKAKAREREQEAIGELAAKKAEADAVRYRQEQEAAGLVALAEARQKLNDATGDNLIRFEVAENLPEMKWPNIYVGEGILTNLFQILSPVKKE